MISTLEEIKIHCEELAATKQEAYDNKSERWQESEKGEEAVETISSLEEAASDAESLLDKLMDLYPDE